MTVNKLSFIFFVVWGSGVGLGVLAANISNFALVGAVVAWFVPVLAMVLFSSQLNSAWWSANRHEAQKVGFQTEATISLKFVIVLTTLLGLLGVWTSWSGHDFFLSAFSGSLLSMATLSANRLFSLSNRKLK